MTEESNYASSVHDETTNQTAIGATDNDYYYHTSVDVLSSDPFHGIIWMLLSLGIIGNILVVVWRLAQKRGQRSSPLSILIIMLAVSDFFYCVHLILLQSLVVDVYLEQRKHLSSTTARNMCMTSAFLSLFSCLTAQWTTFNIAVYSFQAMSEFCSRCCCSLVRKRNLVITIICQVLINVVIIVSYTIGFYIYVFRSDIDAMFGLIFQDFDKYVNTVSSKRVSIAEIFGRCAWAQADGVGFCDTYYFNESYGPDMQTNGGNCGDILGSILASLNTVLTMSCAFLYIFLCLKLRARAANLAERSDMHKLQLRLGVIVFLNTLCWIPVTVLHWITILGYSRNDIFSLSNFSWSNDCTAANVLLISIGPAANPLIYTFTGKNFLLSIRNSFRRMKCHISGRRNSSNYRDDHIPDDWPTEDTSDWNSDQSRLLPSTNELSETI
ncbi:uncharacterized protein LOC134198577 isoform X1 [Corticium candelabrum]|uniref:uncharacterized protein LOC134198577 isoform X1 n=1 Tax=Corticium candelabrum TaxID=121492 RepID=UPI002E26159A|nr:uncharacterized protein LOC134198577 isoform X1 [Corticium candelabrum]